MLKFLIYIFRQRCQEYMERDQQYIGEPREKIAGIIDDCIRKWVNILTFMDDGWTALHLACKTNNEIFLYLISLGADPKIKNKKGMSLMHKAAYDDNTYLITYLRDECHFSVNDVDLGGNTPLHFACSEGGEYAVFWIIGFGADVNVQNKDGDTSMHLLMKNSNKLGGTKSIKELIFKGANKDLKNNWDMKPI